MLPVWLGTVTGVVLAVDQKIRSTRWMPAVKYMISVTRIVGPEEFLESACLINAHEYATAVFADAWPGRIADLEFDAISPGW